MLKNTYNWVKKKILWFFLGGVALAAGVEMFLPTNEYPPIHGEQSLFAEVDENGIVKRVIVIEKDILDTGKWGDPAKWKRTSSKGTVRKNYAGVGWKYDESRDAFIPPKQSDETVFNEEKARWEKPASEEKISATSTLPL